MSTQRGERELGGIFADLETQMRALLADYDDRRALLVDFTGHVNDASVRRTWELTDDQAT